MLHRGSKHRNIRQWPILGLLVIIAFLAHDLLMTVEALASYTSVSDHNRVASNHHHDEPLHFQLREPTPEHPENCGVGQFAAPSLTGNSDPIDQSYLADVRLPDRGTTAHGFANLRWVEPHWPPGILRALLQVYRI